jgi:hypothetical protein
MLDDPASAARVCYAAVRQLRAEHGQRRGPVWALLCEEERAWYIRDAERTWAGLVPRRVHEAWRDDMERLGWKPGTETDHCLLTHPDLRPWEELTDSSQRRYLVIQMIIVVLFLDIEPRSEIPAAL